MTVTFENGMVFYMELGSEGRNLTITSDHLSVELTGMSSVTVHRR